MQVMIDKLRHLGLWPSPRGHFHSVGRIILLAGLVGLVAGLGAIAFQFLSHVVVRFGLEYIAGYAPSSPTGEWKVFTAIEPLFGGFHPWLILVVITLGGLISGVIVYWLAPEAEGHGTDSAIKAYHRNRGIIRPIVPLVKIVCSAITLGTGGSGGREGPIAQIGAGFGSYLATLLKLSDRERRLLLAAGLGAGIAAIFKAPLAGAIFAVEVLYRDEDIEAEALMPAFISCSVAYCVFGLVSQHVFGVISGFEPLLSVQSGLTFTNPLLLGPLTLLAVGMAVTSLAYVRCFYGFTGLFRKLQLPRHFRPAIGALATGLFALAMFYSVSGLGPQAQKDSLNVLSFGYGILQKLLLGQSDYTLTAAVILLTTIGLGKILTTSLSIGSGGSGGVFGPSMVIGGTLGGAMGLVLQHCMPSLVTRPDAFVILGMAGFFSAAAKVPVSTIIMVSELTASYELLLPSMWVCAIAYLLSRGWSIYAEQVPSRLSSPAHRGEFVLGVLKGLTVAKIWKSDAPHVVTFRRDTRLSQVMAMIPETTQTVFPVVNQDGSYHGLFSLGQIRRVIYERQIGEFAIVDDIVTQGVEPLHPDSDLSVVMSDFALEYEELPVVDAKAGTLLGLLRRQDVMSAYNERLAELQAGKE
jgi:CIC family chloride channel protein